MSSISSIAQSGMNAAQRQLDAVATNVAKFATEGLQNRDVLQTALAVGGVVANVASSGSSGSSLATDLVTQLQAKNSFLANLAVFKAGDAIAGALLDQKA
ncbi:flagellar basal body rod protein [Rhodoferax sp. GW822-FHT02A01]|uniref:flagellar basal body rod protein n=1 Tax=Rhodoferax sp. GW822-FHT02A01 TaxID=3141537 RepID=UPI00315CE2AD